MPPATPALRHHLCESSRYPWRTCVSVMALAVGVFIAQGCGPSSPPTPSSDGLAADAGADAGDVSGGLKILSVTPAAARIEDLVEVDIQGVGFFEDARVFFGEEPAEVTYRAGASHLFVMPPLMEVPGRVDVRVENPGAGTVTLKNGFTYLSDVSVEDFEPKKTSALGGEMLTVKGSGFRKGDRVMVGYKLALDSVVLDETTMVALTPALAIGEQSTSKVVVAVRHMSGIAYADAGLEVGVPPKLSHLVPSIVSSKGGSVLLKGAALDNADTLYVRGSLGTLVPGTASSSRGAEVPPASVGLADVLISGPFGHTVLNPGLVYVDGGQSKLFGVSPSVGSTEGGDEVQLLADLAGANVIGARFGDLKVSVSQSAGSLVVKTPKQPAGVVDVALLTDKGELMVPSAFTYRPPLVVSAVIPTAGPTQGGQTVAVHGQGLSADCQVYLGALPLMKLEQTTEGVRGVSPPGSAGTVHVRVSCEHDERVVLDGYHYQPPSPGLLAVLPRQGATGGGTLVSVFGAGFTEQTRVFFDGAEAVEHQWIHESLIRVKTPPHEPGRVTVEVVAKDGSDALLSGYEYFSPTNPQGGTYGAGLVGTLNVTVLDIYTLQPLQGAFVQVGQPGQPGYPAYGEVTDSSGQVVFSGTDLTPPVTVSASKKEYSASSIVNFEVGNATLLLFPWVPPSPGPGGPGPGLPLATVKGRVLDLDKYVLRPPTTCTKPSSGGPQCDFCEQDSDCSSTPGAGAGQWACVVTGGASKRCFNVCKDNTDCDANKDFTCVDDVVDGTRKVCQPSVGIREITCQSSTRQLDSVNPDPGPGAKVDEYTGDYSITVRLDELAVYCVAGYRKQGVFTPTVMGIRRHIFPQPGQVISGVDVQLNIPLVRELDLRLDQPERFHPANNGGDLKVEGWIHLGSDGYVPVADYGASASGSPDGTGVVDTLTLSAQPLTLPLELTDSTYTWRAVVDFGHGATPVPMETGTQHANVVRPGDDNVLYREGASWAAAQVGIATPLVAALPGEATDVLFVAKSGRLLRGTLADPYTLWLPDVVDPYEAPPAMMAAAGTPTDATIVGVKGIIRRLKISAAEEVSVVEEQGAGQGTLTAVCHGDQGRVVVGLGGVVQLDSGDGWQLLSSGTSKDLHAVSCAGTKAVAAGQDGAVVVVDWSGPKGQVSLHKAPAAHLWDVRVATNGKLHVVGADAAGAGVWLSSDDAESWKNELPIGPNATSVSALRCVAETSGGVWLLAGRDGSLWRKTPAALISESPVRKNVAPRAIAVGPQGGPWVVGEPGLWLGPFLTVPDLSRPKDVVNPANASVEWAYAAGPEATMTRVHLDGMGFPFWWLYVNPTTTSVTLPDFNALSALTVLPPLQQPYVARVDRVFEPAYSINAFATYDVEGGAWRSWSTNGKLFSVQQ